jgi:aromatic ring-opening dioxygenase catalytic subunit (LigB family)
MSKGPTGRGVRWSAGTETKQSSIVERGFDHGVFVPLKLMCPAASRRYSCLPSEPAGPKAHVEIGKALAKLRDEGVLIIG